MISKAIEWTQVSGVCEATQNQGYKATCFDEQIKLCKSLSGFELDSLNSLKRSS